MTEITTHTIHCKGRDRATGAVCSVRICYVRDGAIVIPLDSGRELIVILKRGGFVSCPDCGYKTDIGRITKGIAKRADLGL